MRWSLRASSCIWEQRWRKQEERALYNHVKTDKMSGTSPPTCRERKWDRECESVLVSLSLWGPITVLVVESEDILSSPCSFKGPFKWGLSGFRAEVGINPNIQRMRPHPLEKIIQPVCRCETEEQEQEKLLKTRLFHQIHEAECVCPVLFYISQSLWNWTLHFTSHS